MTILYCTLAALVGFIAGTAYAARLFGSFLERLDEFFLPEPKPQPKTYQSQKGFFEYLAPSLKDEERR